MVQGLSVHRCLQTLKLMKIVSIQILLDQGFHLFLVVISCAKFGMLGEIPLHGSLQTVTNWKTSDLGQEHEQEDEEEA